LAFHFSNKDNKFWLFSHVEKRMLNKEDKFVAFSCVEKQKDDEMKEDFT
jgi:hypothetical protein